MCHTTLSQTTAKIRPFLRSVIITLCFSQNIFMSLCMRIPAYNIISNLLAPEIYI